MYLPGKPTVIEFTDRLEAKNFIRIVVDGLGVTPPVVEKVGAEKYKGPGLAVQWVEVEGPLHETWPPPSHRRLFGDLKQAPAPAAEDKNRLEVVSKEPAGRCRAPAPRLPAPRFPAARDRGGRQAVPGSREGQAGCEVLVRAGDARRPQGGPGLAAFPVPAREARPSSTTSPWPAGFPTSCGVRCPMRNCSLSPRQGQVARTRLRSDRRSSAC